MELENVFCKILLCYNLRNNIVNLLLVFFCISMLYVVFVYVHVVYFFRLPLR